MSLKAKTRISPMGNGKGIYLPSSIQNDSTCPLKEGDELVIEIRGNELVIRKKAPKEELE